MEPRDAYKVPEIDLHIAVTSTVMEMDVEIIDCIGTCTHAHCVA